MRKYFITAMIMVICQLAFSLSVSLDTNNDGKDDRWLTMTLMKKWQVFDVNNNSKADETCFYISKSNKVFFIQKEKIDYNHDGKPNIWISGKIKGRNFFREIKIDSNNDGKEDLIRYEENDQVYFQKSDTDFDGKYDSTEEYKNGVKIKENIDTNKDEKPDDHYYYDGDLLLKEEIDDNHDGKPDLWVIFTYNLDGSLKEAVIKKDNNYDGEPDEWHYTNSKRQVIRIEKDTNYDGIVDSKKEF